MSNALRMTLPGLRAPSELADALDALGRPDAVTIASLWFKASATFDTFDARDIDGTLILQTDRKAFVILSSLDMTPSTSDRLVVSGVTYTITNVQRDPASTCWVLQARK